MVRLQKIDTHETIYLALHRFDFAVVLCLSTGLDQNRTGLGVEKVRLAAADFQSSTQDAKNAELLKVFNDTLWNDLDNAGIFDMVSKSFNPTGAVGSPSDVKFEQWGTPPPNAAMLAFGNLGVTGANVTVQGWLYDVKNTSSPQILGKQYTDQASTDAARTIAHKFADEIIFRLGGGLAGIAESKIFYVSTHSGNKEIWVMDYDGANQHALTHLGSISLSPRPSPDGSRIAFSSLTKSGWEIFMYSMDLNRMVAFPRYGGTNQSPAWSPDGTHLAFTSSRTGDSEIYVVDASGSNLQRITFLQRRGCVSYLEPQNRGPDCLGKRTHGIAANLYRGIGWNQRPACDRSGLCGFAILVAERTVSDIFLDTALRPGRAGVAGHLSDGRGQQAVRAIDPRRWTQRFSQLVARRKAYYFSVQPFRGPTDMDYACGRYQSKAANVRGEQFAAELELEVK